MVVLRLQSRGIDELPEVASKDPVNTKKAKKCHMNKQWKDSNLNILGMS